MLEFVDEFAIVDELVDDCDDGVVGVVVISGDDGGELVVSFTGSPLVLFLRLLVIISLTRLFGGWCFFCVSGSKTVFFSMADLY